MVDGLERQWDWERIFDESDFTPDGAALEFGFHWKTMSSWIYGIPDKAEGRRLVKPQTKYRQKAIDMINRMQQEQKLQKHPSYGYATEDEIKMLNDMKLGPNRDAILQRIAKRGKNNGKRR